MRRRWGRWPGGSPTGPGRARAGRLGAWRRRVAVAASSPVRLCFRLEEPPPDAEPAEGIAEGATVAIPAGPWMVRYLLQPHDDPSLLVPAADVWKKRRGKELARLTGGADLRE